MNVGIWKPNMTSKPKMKRAALLGLILSAVSLFTHILLTRYNIDGHPITITIFSWRPVFESAHLSRTGSKHRRLWGPLMPLQNFNLYANPRGKYKAPGLETNGYIFTRIQGGFHEIRSSICALVMVARLRNATSIVPEIQSTTSSEGTSSSFKCYAYLYHEKQFILALGKDVRVLKTLPKNVKCARRKKEIPLFRVPWSTSPDFYLRHVLPALKKHSVVELVVSGAGCLQICKLLGAFGYSPETIIYVSWGSVIGGPRTSIPLLVMFGDVVDRSSLHTFKELTGIYGHEGHLIGASHLPLRIEEERKLEAWKETGPRPLLVPRARPKYPYNMRGWWVWVAENDDEPGSTLAELRVKAHKLLREAIDYVICIKDNLFIPGFDLFASLVVDHRLYQPRVPKAYEPDSPLAPALYVFGDSLSDSGNNNFLHTEAKVNYKPYGIDFPFGVTGRFTNGKTFVDFIAQLLGLPFAPPYLSFSTNVKMNITTGVNYASGSGGILPETGTAHGENLCFDKQIKYFQGTVTNDLLKIFKTPAELLKYLSKSILVISIGNNDYINNYLQPANYNSSQIYTPHQFADLLVDELLRGLKKLYNLGARKFLVFNIGRIGCIPNIVNNLNPKPTTPCVEDVNRLVVLFNTRLPSRIKELERNLVGSTFVRGNSYSAIQNSSESGSTSTETPCCEVDGDGLCLPDQTPCQDRTTYAFWDAFHPTEVVYDRLASDCFNGSISCAPINVQQLAQKQ